MKCEQVLVILSALITVCLCQNEPKQTLEMKEFLSNELVERDLKIEGELAKKDEKISSIEGELARKDQQINQLIRSIEKLTKDQQVKID